MGECLGSGGFTTHQPVHVPFFTGTLRRSKLPAQQQLADFAALVLIGIMLCLLPACRTALSVVAQGGEKQLRPVPPPPTPGPRVLIFALDGAGYNQVMRTLRSGQASRLQTLLGAE